MERFAQYVVAGGLAMVAGLWLAAFAGPTAAPGLVGVALAAVGAAGIGVGIRMELTV